MEKSTSADYRKEVAIAEFFEEFTKLLKSLQPVIEHAVKEYLTQAKRRT